MRVIAAVRAVLPRARTVRFVKVAFEYCEMKRTFLLRLHPVDARAGPLSTTKQRSKGDKPCPSQKETLVEWHI